MSTQTHPSGGSRPGEVDRLGPYRLVHRLGEGGMGVVHLALDATGRAVAVKVLRPHVSGDPDARQRLERELETLSRVRHPRVAAFIDADIHGDRPYLVTRYVAGMQLDEVVAEHGPMRGRPLLRLATGLVEALEAIHQLGIVHRDLKPGNVLLEDDEEPVLIDFGIAHIADDVRLTCTGLVMGTPGYLAPEVIDGAAVTEATDWWGWAATLAFAATGRPPFGRGPMEAVLARVRAGEHDLSGVDARLTPLLGAALDPRASRRPPAGEVVAALERYAAGGTATTETVPAPARNPAADDQWSASERHTRVLPEGPPGWGSTSSPPPAVPTWSPAAAAGPVPRPAARAEWPAPAAGSQWPAPVAGPEGPAPLPEPVDPRIGRPERGGTLAAALGVIVALAATLPVAALAVFAGWGVLARTVDRSMTGFVVRRVERGVRRGDLATSIALGPWHLVGAVIATLGGLVLPLLVGISTLFCAALVVSAFGGGGVGMVSAPTLAVSVLAGVLVAWWGPGGVSLRRGSRSVVRGVVPDGLARDIGVGVLVVGTVALGFWATSRAGVPLWWPMAGPPGFLTVLTGR